MIIVSQDREEIVNFNNIENVWINTEDGIRFLIEATGRMTTTLGVYKTEERAKEVLQEIIEKYRQTNYEYENCLCLRNLIYEMPEE